MRHNVVKKYGKPIPPIDLESIINKELDQIISLLDKNYEVKEYHNGIVYEFNIKNESPEGVWNIQLEPNNKKIIKAYEISFTSPLSSLLGYKSYKTTFGSKILGNHDCDSGSDTD